MQIKQANETNKKQANKNTHKRKGNQGAYLFSFSIKKKASGWRTDQLTFMIVDNSKAMNMQDS